MMAAVIQLLQANAAGIAPRPTQGKAKTQSATAPITSSSAGVAR
jgi:hypothetical protein